MKQILVAVILAISLLAGCTTTPQNSAQAVYAAHGTYTVALTAAVQYKQLPPCGRPTAPVVCSRPEVVARLQQADDVAYTALSNAQRLVRTTPEGSALQQAVSNATQAVNAFAQIVNAIGVK